VLRAPTSSMQLDDLLPESRRVRGPRSWHLNTFLLQSKGVHETGGTPDKHYGSGFLLGVWHEQHDGISYRYAEGRYDELAQRDSEGEAA
ncbi:MAG: hypothetical protein AAF366_19980, partial [Pseudomonadota bacterium]